MDEAWKVRGSERQDLLTRFKDEIMGREGEPFRHFQYELARTCLRFLEDEMSTPTVGQADQWFFTIALPAIRAFARAKEERDVLVADLLSWIIESIAGRFQSDLSHKEIVDPKRMFGAESAMTQI